MAVAAFAAHCKKGPDMPSFSTVRTAAVAALALLALGAQAASVTCQSRNKQREECRLRGYGEVALVRQISSTTCVKGRNWDETRNGLYVTDGCGGVFETREAGAVRPGDRPGERPGERPDPATGRPLTSMSEAMREDALSACLMRFNNEANGAVNGVLESHRRLRPGVWELTLKAMGQRYTCQVNDRALVIAVNPVR